MKKDLISTVVGIYIILISVYWFAGKPTVEWAYYYYLVEKGLTLFGFYLLYKNIYGKFTRSVALYCMSLCVFMVGYFVFTQLFGHSNWMTVGSFLIYSFVILTWIRVRA